jgi:hypothetical protein
MSRWHTTRKSGRSLQELQLMALEELALSDAVEDGIERYGKGRFCLIGEDGNAFSIMGRVQRALLQAGWPEKRVDYVLAEMMSSDYSHLLSIAMSVCENPGAARFVDPYPGEEWTT